MKVLVTHSIRQFPLHFPYRASPCATRFRTSSTMADQQVISDVMAVWNYVGMKSLRSILIFQHLEVSLR